MLYQAAAATTLEERALRTLCNLVAAEESPGSGVDLTYLFEPYPGSFRRETTGRYQSPLGLAHACVDTEISLVMHLLRDRRLIREGISVAAGTDVYVTPDGYAVADAVSRGKAQAIRTGFLICRFTEWQDQLFEQVYGVVGSCSELKCPLGRVKDRHFVERIDDMIIQMINEATVVVVDLTDHNINVAFEAGYALALRKPIVWTMEKPEGDLNLPFDIQSHNILIYERSKLETFRESLRYRMLAALEVARRRD
jgi:hypothetical protein